MKTKIFYSGESQAHSVLQDFFLEDDLELTTRSLLEFSPVPFEIQHPFDVVFISSARSYNYFISQYNGGLTLVFAVIGESTAGKINYKNSSIDFIGKRAGNPVEVAKEFKTWLGDRRVLFPLSSRSNHSVSSHIPKEQKEEIVCYDTALLSPEISEHDLYIFTSPSNVEAFLLKNTLPPSAKVIAWGKTTENYLIKRGIAASKTLETASEKELVRILKELI